MPKPEALREPDHVADVASAEALIVVPTADVQQDPSWWLTAICTWLVLLVPPFMMMKPKRPTEQDVLQDIALRRLVGMDDTVAK